MYEECSTIVTESVEIELYNEETTIGNVSDTVAFRVAARLQEPSKITKNFRNEHLAVQVPRVFGATARKKWSPRAGFSAVWYSRTLLTRTPRLHWN